MNKSDGYVVHLIIGLAKMSIMMQLVLLWRNNLINYKLLSQWFLLTLSYSIHQQIFIFAFCIQISENDSLVTILWHLVLSWEAVLDIWSKASVLSQLVFPKAVAHIFIVPPAHLSLYLTYFSSSYCNCPWTDAPENALLQLPCWNSFGVSQSSASTILQWYL